jgi:C4-dicarboxylate transporter DctQ subunit
LILGKLKGFGNVLESVCRHAAAGLMLFMMVFIFAEIASRFLFNLSHEFVPAISSWAMVWMTFFTFGVALRAREHINVDILPGYLHGKGQTLLLAFYDVLSLLFAILLCIGSIKYLLMVKNADVFAVTVQFIPMWIVRLCVPLGGIFLALFACEHLIDDVWHLMNRDGEGE